MSQAGDDTLIARDLHFAYQKGRDVLRGADLTARSGALLCILGPNGSGKTTLLRCLLGRLTPQRGRILLADCPLGSYLPRQRARQLAYVPQFPSSAFDFTAGQIVQMGRLSHTGPLGLVGANDREVVRLAMQMTDTVEFMDRSLMELSGGEAQRVMIARALAQQPSVLLLDEPTSHLDVRHQMTIYRMMTRLAHDWRMAVVCVSHDVNLAARFADELIVMKDGQVLADGPARDVICPEVLSEAYDVQVALVDSGDEMPMVRVI